MWTYFSAFKELYFRGQSSPNFADFLVAFLLIEKAWVNVPLNKEAWVNVPPNEKAWVNVPLNEKAWVNVPLKLMNVMFVKITRESEVVLISDTEN